MSIKYPELEKYKNRRIVLLDSAGLETPVIKENNEIKEGSELFREKSREKIITELFLQNYIIHNSDILIVVLGILSYSEQKILNRIKIELKRAKLNKTLYVIHNLMTFTSIYQVKNYINDLLLKSATFDLVEKERIDFDTESPKGICYFEKNSNPQIFHLIFANEYSEAGAFYNEYTLKFLEKQFDSISDIKGFNIIETIKDRFREVSREIIENLKEEIEFDPNCKNTIKLLKPQEISLKKCFIDELGFSNLRATGFEPNYNYYQNKNNQIVVKVEAPGKCTIKSSIQHSGEYTIIKISGNKEKDKDPLKTGDNFFNGRENGEFSLDIPLKLENNYIIRNEKPKIVKEDGIFILVYQLELDNSSAIFS